MSQPFEDTTGRSLSGAISEGMHQLAQPLTCVMAALELLLVEAKTFDECRVRATEALAEVDRTLEALHYVRELVRLQNPPDEEGGRVLSMGAQQVR